MSINELVALKLISEIKKPGRECMYDMSNSACKNNHTKRIIWTEITNAIGIGRAECQALWKSLRRRHKAAIRKNYGKYGNERVEVKGFSTNLMTEMDYFLDFCNGKKPVADYIHSNSPFDEKPCVPNYIHSNNIFDEKPRDIDVSESSINSCERTSHHNQPFSMTFQPQKLHRQNLINSDEDEYKMSIKSLNNLAATVLQASAEKRDPFFLALEDEFSKVPDNRKSVLKVKLMSLIVEHQE